MSSVRVPLYFTVSRAHRSVGLLDPGLVNDVCFLSFSDSKCCWVDTLQSKNTKLWSFSIKFDELLYNNVNNTFTKNGQMARQPSSLLLSPHIVKEPWWEAMIKKSTWEELHQNKWNMFIVYVYRGWCKKTFTKFTTFTKFFCITP